MQTEPKSESWSLPADLGEWFPTDQLWAMAMEGLEGFSWDNPQVIAYLQEHPDYQPKMLLGLLTCSYLCGVYRSRDIVRRAREDIGLKAALGGFLPDARELSKFRKENRGLLKTSMVELLKKALQKKYGLLGVLLPPGVKTLLVDEAGTRLDMARHMDREEI